MGERVVEVRILEAAFVGRGGQGEEGLFASGELVEGWTRPAGVWFSHLSLRSSKVQQRTRPSPNGGADDHSEHERRGSSVNVGRKSVERVYIGGRAPRTRGVMPTDPLRFHEEPQCHHQ